LIEVYGGELSCLCPSLVKEDDGFSNEYMLPLAFVGIAEVNQRCNVIGTGGYKKSPFDRHILNMVYD
jgi:hypothetical protein